MNKEIVDVLGAERIIVFGHEGALRLTAKGPTRSWLQTSSLGSSKRPWEDYICLPSFSLHAERGYIRDGGHRDRWTGQHKMFYCRILPDDARAELHRLDVIIEAAHIALVQAQRERQDFLASCARRGARVPAPPKAPKPTTTTEEK